jgi:LysR family transcriptional regulator, hydrogen peroxide-inducible genes activator
MAALNSLKQLRYLVALDEQLSFTRAASRCFVTQSTLSAGLKELERTLGAKLVERDRQSVLMTPVGREVAQRARALLAGAQDIVEMSDRQRAPFTGLLRLGVIPTIAPFLLPRGLRLAQRRYPQLRLALREDLTAELLARLADGRLDLAIIALPFDTGELAVLPLFEDELRLVARRRDPSVRSEPVALDHSLADRLLLLAEGHCLREHALSACGAQAPANDTRLEATSLPTLVQMVESGLGLGLVPELALRAGLIRGSRLVSRSLARPAPRRTIALVARRTTTHGAEMEALARICRQIGRGSR